MLAEGCELWVIAGDWHREPHGGETGEVRGGLLAGRPGDQTPGTGLSGLLKRWPRLGARVMGGVALGAETGDD